MQTEFVLITGVSKGIGRATAKRLTNDGYRVIGIDIDTNAPDCLEHFERVDLANAEQSEQALRNLTERYRIQRLVNNVGTSKREFLLESDGSTQRLLSRLNVGSVLSAIRAVLPTMRSTQFGRIVNIASRAVFGRETRGAYSATKSALAIATRSWARDLAADGITVNAVAPGMIDTDLFRSNNPPGAPDVSRLRDNIPARRIGTPEDVANAIAFFLDYRSGYVTGQLLLVCGGLSLGIHGTRRVLAMET